MGTSKESQRSSDEDDGEVIIPWRFVPYSVRRELITKLNPDVTMSGNDWRMLASELGYTTGEISFIESEKDNNTTVLFRHYDTKPGASLNDVYRSLEKMQRHDCLEVIRNALSEIQQAYNKSNESQNLHVAETSEMLASRPHYQWPGSPYACPCHILPLPNNISTVDNSNLFSSDSSNSDSFNNRQKVARQYSDECNITQASSGDKRFRNISSSRDTLGSIESIDQHGLTSQRTPAQVAGGIRPQNSHNKCPKFVHPSDASALGDYRERFYEPDSEVKVRNESGEPVTMGSGDVSNQGSYSEAKTSLAHLAKLATVPDKFKPTNEYTTVVAKQKIDIDKHKDGKGSLDCSSHSNGSSIDRSHPSTFPMRVKVKHERGMEDIKNLTISKKSASMPQNMKPVEYRKAFRHIKVFVTYSYDNESHGKQVLSLCKFLQSNGFACCVDVCERKTSAKSLEQLEWCRKKVLEADFVLVCISPRYLEDISPSSSTLPQNNQRKLHTREIYELMNSEYLNNQHGYDGESNSCVTSPPRFVPLLFPKMTHSHVPAWMMNGPAYMWPNQYKDLAWMLTKPQERIRGRKEALEEHFEER
ncbi:unnamed protein product [Candidula unifasciata]|uniref:SEFIR domain-containing protein n=1 Tax=Candidula unifasciata TaxID=100452 RepID=A0A8S3YY00_9EUPU|nr:unnamed protein product [Candidula unifasciata]